MRLISARIRGWGRLADSKVNLDAKLVAIVGPNEAGKTTLLRALRHVDSGQRLEPALRSRTRSVPDDEEVTIISYVLDDRDHERLADLDLAEYPDRMTVSRPASGEAVRVVLTPTPQKSTKPLATALPPIRKASALKKVSSLFAADGTYAAAADGDSQAVRNDLDRITQHLESIHAGDSTAVDPEIEELARVIGESLVDDISAAVGLRSGLTQVVEWSSRPDPREEAERRLWSRSPDFLLFDEPDRSLRSAYNLDEALLQDVPPALSNLAGTAGLDLTALLQHIRDDDVARRDTALEQANRKLDELFSQAWKQSRLAVQVRVDGPLLRVLLLENGGNVTVFDERSAGLRTFVALICFLRVHASDRPPILLIDEAENHLHIDAQADLVNMFVTQVQAVKVIYTTHSPACLPPDLGTGIRCVVPSADQQISEVKNSFWEGSGGFSPLMLAMGAGAAAFTPARCVLLAEGASEMILLPSLLRSAAAIGTLPYQVAPGLSEVPAGFYPQLDLEAARVAYLVDGDSGGDELAKALRASGVPSSLIAKLKVPGVENLLDSEAYQAAITSLLDECNPEVSTADARLPNLPPPASESWAKYIEAWISTRGLRPPSRVAVANWLVMNERATPSSAGKRHLNRVHQFVVNALLAPDGVDAAPR